MKLPLVVGAPAVVPVPGTEGSPPPQAAINKATNGAQARVRGIFMGGPSKSIGKDRGQRTRLPCLLETVDRKDPHRQRVIPVDARQAHVRLAGRRATRVVLPTPSQQRRSGCHAAPQKHSEGVQASPCAGQ